MGTIVLTYKTVSGWVNLVVLEQLVNYVLIAVNRNGMICSTRNPILVLAGRLIPSPVRLMLKELCLRRLELKLSSLILPFVNVSVCSLSRMERRSLYSYHVMAAWTTLKRMMKYW